MIKKLHRLKQGQIKKVLRKREPFFSSPSFTANVTRSFVPHSRFAIFLSGKNCSTSVGRNFYRRLFYTTTAPYCLKGSHDVVFRPKKGKVFRKDSQEDAAAFSGEVSSLLERIYANPRRPCAPRNS